MSGVYISGLNMPSCCGECRFLCEYGDYPTCIITDEQRGYNFRVREKRMPHCPLIPVPDHLKLVDKNALLAECEWANTDDDTDVRVVRYDIIKEAPTIIPADKEVRT